MLLMPFSTMQHSIKPVTVNFEPSLTISATLLALKGVSHICSYQETSWIYIYFFFSSPENKLRPTESSHQAHGGSIFCMQSPHDDSIVLQSGTPTKFYNNNYYMAAIVRTL